MAVGKHETRILLDQVVYANYEADKRLVGLAPTLSLLFFFFLPYSLLPTIVALFLSECVTWSYYFHFNYLIILFHFFFDNQFTYIKIKLISYII